MVQTQPRPRLRVLFHFGAHGSLADLSHVDSVMDSFRPHALFIEGAHATEESQKELEKDRTLVQSLFSKDNPSQHDAFAYELGEDNSERFRYGLIAASLKRNIPIRYIEQVAKPVSADMSKKRAELKTVYDTAKRSLEQGELGRAIDLYKTYQQGMDHLKSMRDQHILHNFRTRVLDWVLTDRPELAHENEIRIVCRLGAEHRIPYLKLKGEPGIQVEQVFDTPPRGTHSFQRQTAAALSEKPVEYDDEKLAQEMVGNSIAWLMSSLTDESYKRITLAQTL